MGSHLNGYGLDSAKLQSQEFDAFTELYIISLTNAPLSTRGLCYVISYWPTRFFYTSKGCKKKRGNRLPFSRLRNRSAAPHTVFFFPCHQPHLKLYQTPDSPHLHASPHSPLPNLRNCQPTHPPTSSVQEVAAPLSLPLSPPPACPIPLPHYHPCMLQKSAFNQRRDEEICKRGV